MESDLNGKESNGAHKLTPELNSGATSVVCCVRAPSSRCLRRLFAQHARRERPLEPIGRGNFTPLFQPRLLHEKN
jgi:hypothetical protein